MRFSFALRNTETPHGLIKALEIQNPRVRSVWHMILAQQRELTLNLPFSTVCRMWQLSEPVSGKRTLFPFSLRKAPGVKIGTCPMILN